MKHPSETQSAHRADTGEKHSVSLVCESVVIVMVNNRPRTHHLDMSLYSACVLWTDKSDTCLVHVFSWTEL